VNTDLAGASDHRNSIREADRAVKQLLTAQVRLFNDSNMKNALKISGYVLGGVLLLACGGDAGTAPPPPPPPADSWVQKASLPGGPLSGAVSFVAQGKLYVGTGIRNGFEYSFNEYDPTGDRWTYVVPLPVGVRSNAIAFAIGDYGYVGLGYNCLGGGLCTFNYFNDLWRFDPRTWAWDRMADFPGTARAFAASFVIGEKAYVTGGSHANDYDLWEYDPAANTWTKKADYPGRCPARGTAFSVAGKGYVGLGSSNGSCTDFWSYDPSANSWTAIATFPGLARYDALGFSVTNTPFIVGGARELNYLTDVWTYSPASNAWVQLQTAYPGKGRSQMIAGIVAGRIFLGLGTNFDTGGPESRFDDFWEYVPAK
jgi:N-acetylneuraminic acid mutarotase